MNSLHHRSRTAQRLSRRARPIPCLDPLESRLLLTSDGLTAALPIYTGTPPTISIVATRPAASETKGSTAGAGQFVFTRSGGDINQAFPFFLDVSGSAGNTLDYNFSGGYTQGTPWAFAAGQKTLVVNVNVIDDALAESDETVTLTLNNSLNVPIDLPASFPPVTFHANPQHTSATVTIHDNEPVVSIVKLRNASEANPNAAGKGQFSVLRTGGQLNQPLTVNYTLSGTAGADDYNPLSGSVTIPANASSAFIDVVPVTDALIEPTETVIATVLPGADYNLTPTLARRSATVTIANVLAVDFAAATGFTTAGGVWNYDCSGTATGTAHAAVTSPDATFTRYTSVGTWANGAQSQGVLDWQAAGSSIALLHATLWSGTLNFADLQVSPAILAGTSTDSSPVTWDIGPSGDGAGTATVRTSLLGLVTLTLPSGTYTAYKIDMNLSLAISGHQLESGLPHAAAANVVDDRLIYAVPGVGIVKMVETFSYTSRVQGHRAVSGKSSLVSVFRDNAAASSSTSGSAGTTTTGSTLSISGSGASGATISGATTLNSGVFLNSGSSGTLTLNSTNTLLPIAASGAGTLVLNPGSGVVGSSSNTINLANGTLTNLSGTLTLTGALPPANFTTSVLNNPSVISGSALALSGPNASTLIISGTPLPAPNPGGAGTIGTVNVPCDLTLSATSVLSFDVQDASADLLAISGQLRVLPDPSSKPTIQLITTGTLTGPYTLVTYAATPGISADSFNLPAPPPNYQWNITDTSIQIVPVA